MPYKSSGIDYSVSKRPLLNKIQQMLNVEYRVLSNKTAYRNLLITGLRNSISYYCKNGYNFRDDDCYQQDNHKKQPRQTMIDLLKQVLNYLEKDCLEYSVEVFVGYSYKCLRYKIAVSNTHVLTVSLHYNTSFNSDDIFVCAPRVRYAECNKTGKMLHIGEHKANFYLIPAYKMYYQKGLRLDYRDFDDMSIDDRKCELSRFAMERIHFVAYLEDLASSIISEKFLFEEKAIELSKLVNSLIKMDSIKPLKVNPKYRFHRKRNALKKDSYRKKLLQANSVKDGLNESSDWDWDSLCTDYDERDFDDSGELIDLPKFFE